MTSPTKSGTCVLKVLLVLLVRISFQRYPRCALAILLMNKIQPIEVGSFFHFSHFSWGVVQPKQKKYLNDSQHPSFQAQSFFCVHFWPKKKTLSRPTPEIIGKIFQRDFFGCTKGAEDIVAIVSWRPPW